MCGYPVFVTTGWYAEAFECNMEEWEIFYAVKA